MFIQVGHPLEPDACAAIFAMNEEYRWIEAFVTWLSGLTDQQFGALLVSVRTFAQCAREEADIEVAASMEA